MSAFIPADAEWYVADLVVEIRVEGDPRSVVHINTVLVNARSPDEAFSRAWQLGQESEQEYLNPSNLRVTFRFRGLRHLGVIDDPLEHGGEIVYSERIGLGESEIQSLVRDRESLAVFRAPEPSDRPDYSCGEIVAEAVAIARRLSKRTDETRMVEEILRQTFPQTDAYRYNSASIRVRIVDPRFKGKSTERRDAMVEPLIEQLPRETQAEIMNLLTLYPDETADSFEALALNEEFEKPSPSSL